MITDSHAKIKVAACRTKDAINHNWTNHGDVVCAVGLRFAADAEPDCDRPIRRPILNLERPTSEADREKRWLVWYHRSVLHEFETG